ncbi:phage minor tail protein G [Escherichia coli]
MPTPNPLAPVKGAGTTLWVYNGNGDPYANPLSDNDWSRLAKVKDLTPGELTAESYDDSYLDDEDADWAATGQGQKSAGDTSFTLAWMPGEQGQQALLAWFNEGDTRAYKIRFPNGTVDVFRGWVSSIGKAVTAKEVITRTVKVTNVGRPSMAEDRSTVTAATGMTVTLSELSALQRIEHLALMKRQAEQAESDSNRKFTVEDAIRTGAFVVAMSLWHNHPKKTQMPSMNEAVKQIEQEVLTTWPAEAISHAENVVYRLSGMYEFVVNDAPEQAEDAGPAEPVSAGKCSTVS